MVNNLQKQRDDIEQSLLIKNSQDLKNAVDPIKRELSELSVITRKEYHDRNSSQCLVEDKIFKMQRDLTQQIDEC
jgi:hypothetical protein